MIVLILIGALVLAGLLIIGGAVVIKAFEDIFED